jgi:hypothetical protein
MRIGGSVLIRRRQQSFAITPQVNSDRKLEPSHYPALAAFDIKVDRKSKFSVLLLAMATVCRTIANARLRPELTQGCISSVSISNGGYIPLLQVNSKSTSVKI